MVEQSLMNPQVLELSQQTVHSPLEISPAQRAGIRALSESEGSKTPTVYLAQRAAVNAGKRLIIGTAGLTFAGLLAGCSFNQYDGKPFIAIPTPTPGPAIDNDDGNPLNNFDLNSDGSCSFICISEGDSGE